MANETRDKDEQELAEAEEFLEFEDDQTLDALGAVLPDDETITQEQINEMKMLGVAKPHTVSWERWNQIQNFRSEHHLMVKMAAVGRPQSEIAEALGYTQAHVSKVLNTPEIKAKVKKEIDSIYGDDVKNALKARAVKAVQVIDDTLDYGKPSERFTAAQYVLDHTVGKAQQTAEVKVHLLTQVMDYLSKLRDVSPNQNQLPQAPDPFDTVIEQVIPKNMTVGVRSNGEGSKE